VGIGYVKIQYITRKYFKGYVLFICIAVYLDGGRCIEVGGDKILSILNSLSNTKNSDSVLH